MDRYMKAANGTVLVVAGTLFGAIFQSMYELARNPASQTASAWMMHIGLLMVAIGLIYICLLNSEQPSLDVVNNNQKQDSTLRTISVSPSVSSVDISEQYSTEQKDVSLKKK